MHRIDGPGATVDNKFTDGDPVGGVQATIVTDDWLNDVQENIMAVLAAAGVAPTKGRAADLMDSIRASTTGRLIGVRVFPGNGAYIPSPGMVTAVMEVQGGGGSGAGITTPGAGNISLGGPGACGAYALGRFSAASIGASQVVTVGGGGTIGAGAAGGAGGTSSVGSLITAPGGGGGGLLNNQVSPITNGNGSVTALPTGANIFGIRGVTTTLSISSSASFGYGGAGGPSKFGSGGGGGSINGNGAAAPNFGAGGGGTCGASGSATLTGGAGCAGIVIIWEYA